MNRTTGYIVISGYCLFFAVSMQILLTSNTEWSRILRNEERQLFHVKPPLHTDRHEVLLECLVSAHLSRSANLSFFQLLK